MNLRVLIVASLLASCAAPHERFGASVGVQRFTPADSVARRYDPADMSAYLNTRYRLFGGWTAQAQLVFPLNGAEPLLGLRLDCELPMPWQ